MQHGISTSLLWHFGITAQYVPMYFKADMLLVRIETSSVFLKIIFPINATQKAPKRRVGSVTCSLHYHCERFTSTGQRRRRSFS